MRGRQTDVDAGWEVYIKRGESERERKRGGGNVGDICCRLKHLCLDVLTHLVNRTYFVCNLHNITITILKIDAEKLEILLSVAYTAFDQKGQIKGCKTCSSDAYSENYIFAFHLSPHLSPYHRTNSMKPEIGEYGKASAGS